VTVIGGSGADVITLNAGAGLATITTGAGADRIVIGGAAANLNSYATITDFGAGDTLVFPNKGNETFGATKIALAPTATFQDYADAAITAGGNASVNGYVAWFQFSGDTYVVVSQHDGSGVNNTFQNGTDIAVKLTGLIDLSSSFNDLGASNGSAGIPEIRG
jgi:S-layer protein